MQVSYLKVEILTPVHIGTGDEVDPMGYLMRREEGEIACYFVDTTTWAAEHPDPANLSVQFESDNIPRIRAYIAENLDPLCYGRRRATVSNSGIFEEHTEKLRDQTTTNQLLISPQLTTALGRPLLPGSSVKGAIRTAIIDHLDRSRNLNLRAAAADRDRREYDRKLEQIFGKITDSAFKQFKISDFEGWSDSTVLVTATEVRRNPEKIVTPKCHAETLPSTMLGNPDHAVLYGKLVMGYGQAKDPENCRLTLSGGESWDWNGLAEQVNAYQKKRFVKELRDFYSLPHFGGTSHGVVTVKQALEKVLPGQMILRLGHYSQVEYVTVENNAPMTRKGKDGQYLPWGTTRTLANGQLPFGWVRLTPCSLDEYLHHQEARQKHREALDSERLTRRQQIAVEKEQRMELQRRRQLEKEDAEKHPWRALLCQLARMDNWGDFRQFVLDGPLQKYRDKENVASLARDKALELRRSKWDTERDAMVAHWLEPTGLPWELEVQQEEIKNSLSTKEQKTVDMIAAFADWGQFRAANIDIESLPKAVLTVVRDRLREWGCDNPKAKKDKKDSWKTAQRTLKRG